MGWSFRDDIPIYRQLMEKIKMEILSGSYAPGSQIPAVREIAMEAGVNPNTMQRAFSELEREGLLYTERTNGRFVTNDEAILNKLKKEMCQGYIEDLYNNLQKLALTKEDIVEAVIEWSKEEK